MPALHKIDNDTRLIITTWTGDAVDSELIDALTKYQQDIRSRPEYCSYNEIVDFSQTIDFKLSSDGLRRLVQIAAQGDVPGVRTKLAIVVNKPVAYGLARMYEVYRNFVPGVSKEVRVFRDYAKALGWIADEADTDSLFSE